MRNFGLGARDVYVCVLEGTEMDKLVEIEGCNNGNVLEEYEFEKPQHATALSDRVAKTPSSLSRSP